MRSPNQNERERRFRTRVHRIVLLIVVVWAGLLVWGAIEVLPYLWNMGD